MTDLTPLSDDELDLAASLAIDGQEWLGRSLSDDDRRRVEARMAELRTAVAAVGEPVTPPAAEVRAAHLTTALAAGDPGGKADPAATTPPPAPRPLTRRRGRTVLPWAAAAAAVVAMVVALAALAGQGGSHPDTTASKAETAAGVGAGPPSSTTTAPISPQSRYYQAERELGGLTDLGSAASSDQLAVRARAALSPATTTTAGATLSTSQAVAGGHTGTNAPNGRIGDCMAAAGGLSPPLGQVVLEARAIYAGRPVAVLVYRATTTDTGPRYLVAFDPATCRILVDRPL